MPFSPYLDLLEALRTNCSLPEFPDPLPSTQLDFELENGPTVTIDFDEESQFVQLFSELGTYVTERELELLRKIAKANFSWSKTNGATLSVRPEIQTGYLALQLPVLSLNGTDFIRVIEKFIETAKQWKEIIAGVAIDETSPAANSEQPLKPVLETLSQPDNFIKA